MWKMMMSKIYCYLVILLLYAPTAAYALNFSIKPHPVTPGMNVVTVTDGTVNPTETRSPASIGIIGPVSVDYPIEIYFYRPPFTPVGWCSGYGPTANLPACNFLTSSGILMFRAPPSTPTADASLSPAAIYSLYSSALNGMSTTLSTSITNQFTLACARISVRSVAGTSGGGALLYSCEPVNTQPPVACEATTPNTTIDFLTFNASELRTGRKQSTQVNIQCTGGGGTVNVSSNEYDNTGKKVIRNDGGDDLYAIITASLNGGEKPITPTGQPLTLLEGGNPLTIWADIRANEPQKHEGFFTSTSVITLTYQ